MKVSEINELATQLNDILDAIDQHIKRKDRRTALKSIQQGEAIIKKLGACPALQAIYTKIFKETKERIP